MIHLGMRRYSGWRNIDKDDDNTRKRNSKEADYIVPFTGNGSDVNHGHSLLLEVLEDIG
jgi:hypothetical protein